VNLKSSVGVEMPEQKHLLDPVQENERPNHLISPENITVESPETAEKKSLVEDV